mmetsp:Transcript_48384/g.105325  ORF Transcript_48384/g.105325 Transcript_48384/m.105325 type:complete len:204 (+) Transcript_48384:62-673(+)
MFTENRVIVDCKGHMLGRLASCVAKELLNGQKVVLVRCEKLNQSGSLYRNFLKWGEFRRKATNVKHAHGPFHHRAPSKIMQRAIRGMIPHKTFKGRCALDRLEVFDGIPPKYARKKLKIVPRAQKINCLKPHRPHCTLGDLSTKAGWKYKELIERLEAKRMANQAKYWEVKKGFVAKWLDKKAAAAKKLTKDQQEILTAAGVI